MSNPSVTTKAFDPLAAGMDTDPMTQLERIFVYFLQNLFRTFPEGCGMRWHSNVETTEMIITSEKPELSAIEKLPHIVCIFGSQRWANLGLDQLQNVKFMTGRRKHTDLISATVAYHCQAKEGAVARRIAWNASLYTNVFKRIIMKVNGIHQVASNHDISAEAAPTAYMGPLVDTELVGVVVTVPFFWQPMWVIQSDAVSVWRSMKMSLSVRSNLSIEEPPEIAFTQDVKEESYPT